MNTLNRQQQKVANAVRWLVVMPRGIGKSYAIAYGLVQSAIDRSPEPVYVFDHSGIQKQLVERMIKLCFTVFTEFDEELQKTACIKTNGRDWIKVECLPGANIDKFKMRKRDIL